MSFAMISLWLLIPLIICVLSSLPLYFSVKFLGSEASLLKVILVNLLVPVLVFVVRLLFDSWGGVFAFIAMIWVYHEFFEIGWIKALIAWGLQLVIALILVIVLVLLLSLGILVF